jgi:CBS-domain-containing membrane protein
MKASDVMVRDIFVVGPEASIADVAKILLEKRISAVPVVAGDKVVGIVSEGDLLQRAEAGTQPHRSWWLELFTNDERRAAEFTRSHSRKVSDVMTREVITAEPDTPLADVAALLMKHRIKRVPIVTGGKLIGIVSRADVLQFVAGQAIQIPINQDDASLREKVLARMNAEPWARTALVNVSVKQGIVELSGLVYSDEQRKALQVAAEITPGVREVKNNLAVRPVTAGV